MKANAILAGVIYVGTVVLANWLTATYGLVSIGFGLLVAAGTFAAGASLIVRDWVQQASRRQYVVPVLIVVAALISAVTATPALALASGIAFLCSELVDWAVFTPILKRSLPAAVLVSSVVSAPVDTVLFLALAGFPVTWEAMLGQFLVKTGMALLVAIGIGLRER